MQFCRVLLLIGVAANAIDAATITSGFVGTTNPQGFASFSIAAENSISFTTGIVSIEVGSEAQFRCDPCAPGDSISLGGGASPDGFKLAPDLIVNGVPRRLGVYIDLRFTSSRVTITEAEVYTAPFTASGFFFAGDEFDPEIRVPLTGRGFVTLELDSFIYPEHGLVHELRSLTYEFQLIPEPSAIWLVLAGGALMAVGHRLRRASRNRS
jgi:hypothetical protein